MSDNLRRYRAIRNALTQAYPTSPTGNFLDIYRPSPRSSVASWAARARSCPPSLPKCPMAPSPRAASNALPGGSTTSASWKEMYFLPYAEILLMHLALETLVLVMDGSVVGRGCAALMLHVIYKGRALPLAWRVRQGPKGHFPEDLHIALVDLMRACLPEGGRVPAGCG